MNYKKLILSILVCQLAGIIGSFFTLAEINSWYAGLAKPMFNPPNYVFGPVWIGLYTLMGVSLYLALEKGLFKEKNNFALYFFSIQLILNLFWTMLFFGLKNIFLALIEIILLWFFIALTIKEFYSIDRKAAYLLVPYFLWVSFALALNYFIFVLN